MSSPALKAEVAPARRRAPVLAHVALIAAGLLLALYPFTLGPSVALRCRGEVLTPGQTCAKADGSAQQTYEQRKAATDAATPVLVVVGLGVAALGVGLVVGSRRRPVS